MNAEQYSRQEVFKITIRNTCMTLDVLYIYISGLAAVKKCYAKNNFLIKNKTIIIKGMINNQAAKGCTMFLRLVCSRQE